LAQYVCARVTRIDNSDIALFDRDWNNTLYYFVMNSDEHIYLRYGGRDSRSPDTYLSLSSLEIALERGLEIHRRYQGGEIKPAARPKPLFPRDFKVLAENTLARRRCVECHLVNDYRLVEKEQEGTLDKLVEMYRSPDIRTIGIELDVPKGLVVKEARADVQAAGMQAGDEIAGLNGTPVYTFGDLQYRYDKLPRDARQMSVTVNRGGRPVELAIALPAQWWVTDLRFRQLSVEPRPEFESRPLTAAEKEKLGLKAAGFAAEVKSIGGFAQMLKVHELKAGDIVFAVDGVEVDEIADTPELYIRLRSKAGDKVTLGYIRDGKQAKMEVRTQSMAFRK